MTGNILIVVDGGGNFDLVVLMFYFKSFIIGSDYKDVVISIGRKHKDMVLTALR